MKGSLLVRSALLAALFFLSPTVFAAGEDTDSSQSDMPKATQVVEAGKVVHINTDDAETIAEVLDGVGMARARAIVEYRELNGPFASAEELVEVKGIGEQTLSKNMDRIRVE